MLAVYEGRGQRKTLEKQIWKGVHRTWMRRRSEGTLAGNNGQLSHDGGEGGLGIVMVRQVEGGVERVVCCGPEDRKLAEVCGEVVCEGE